MSRSKLNRRIDNILYDKVFDDNDSLTMRELCLTDLFYLLVVGCKRRDMNNEWCYARCREVEGHPNDHLDLWFRSGYKSSVITFGLSIQDILKDPEITIGIFSHTRPIAKAFLSQIKREFETNQFLKDLFPDILYQDPQKESPKWSLDDGIIVKRQGNPKEHTVEAYGLVDGQPTSKHYRIMVYDDVVVPGSVTSPEMIAKTTEAFGLSLNLASEHCHKRYIGTRYHSQDTYQTILDRGTAIPRIYPATIDGKITGESVFLPRDILEKKLRDMGSYVFSSQMLQNPLADGSMGFNIDWLRYYTILKNYSGWNFYITVDPAGEKKKTNDYTVISVIGLAPDNNYYLVDGIRDRLNLTERTRRLFEMVRKWQPKRVGYEKYGMQADIEHIKYVQEQEEYRFNIEPLGGSMSKPDRIRRLVPIFEQGRFYIPHSLLFITIDGKAADLIALMIKNEYLTFPVSTHDDIMDCIARILDPELTAVFPKITEPLPVGIPQTPKEFDYDPLTRSNPKLSSPTAKGSNWKDLMKIS